MPWVKLDDRFPTHRKVALLSDRAFRLYVSALCWSSENLTEGRIADRELPVISRVRGPMTVAKELEKAGLWDRTDDGWAIHDYLIYNPDKEQVKAERAANASRQQAYRDRKKAEREAETATRNAPRNGVTDTAADASERTTATRRRHDGDTNSRKDDPTNHASPQVGEIRNGVSNGTPSRPVPNPYVPPTEVRTDYDEPDRLPLPVIGDRPRIPANARPLVEAITEAGMVVGWDLNPGEWLIVEALLQRCGTAALLQDATGSWQGARTRPRSAKYFLPAWRKLPDIPEHARNLPAIVNGTGPMPPVSRQQQETDDWFDRVMTRAVARDEQRKEIS